MCDYLYRLLSCCFKGPDNSVQELDRSIDWGSTPSLPILESPISEESIVPFDHLGHLDIDT